MNLVPEQSQATISAASFTRAKLIVVPALLPDDPTQVKTGNPHTCETVIPPFAPDNHMKVTHLLSFAGRNLVPSVRTVQASRPDLIPRAGALAAIRDHHSKRPASTSTKKGSQLRKMGKKKGPSAPESSLLMPLHDALKNSQEHLPIIDTHCHLFSTYSFYKSKYPDGQHASVQDFIRAYMRQQTSTLVEGVVDVYCEPPFAGWKE